MIQSINRSLIELGRINYKKNVNNQKFDEREHIYTLTQSHTYENLFKIKRFMCDFDLKRKKKFI